ncbi:hypothetical protein [Vibrio mediterranei]|uniref:hypothetical protein n=1 Tax=Vibrio mediterranei TaxID=689 RepID=UPI00148BD6FB|nr:hypothetical protein [Vibrio mediterranei]NOH31647.1 hypothetical protein [Vibrio mediterranei]
MIEELKPLTETIGERSKKPVISGFVFSWLVVNFEAWSLLVVGPLDEYESRLKVFLSKSNWYDFLLIPASYAVVVYLVIFGVTLLVAYLNVFHLRKVSERSGKLAEAQYELLKMENEGKEYVEMEAEYN